MNYFFWIWWLFELCLLFLADMAYYILGIILLGWVAKIGLSQRHRQQKLMRYRLFQDRFHEDRFRKSFDE
jgi:hypothetical protein